MPSKPFVYISSPYTKGNAELNTRFQMQVWDELMTTGLVWPFAPLWNHFQHLTFRREYEDWLAYDLALIKRMDARFDELDYHQSESSGADREVAEFERQGKPVFYSIDDLLAWVNRYAGS